MEFGPTHTIFDSFDSQWCLDQCQQIINDFPMTESSNISGKFFHTYKTWHFHKTSQIPIIKEFNNVVEKHKHQFEKVYNKPLEIDWVVLAYTSDDSEEMSVWHKDRYYLDGQFHITVQGNANIDVDKDGEVFNLQIPNGTAWYLNATHYYHKICPGVGNERFELTAPVNMRPALREWKLKANPNDKWQHVKGDNPEYVKYKEFLVKGQEQAVRDGTASNISVAYPVDLQPYIRAGK
jgi:hypothetical protein|tara:strand:- start:2799 stop:3506 length:708 start_codon:yes stop_codon:yes gene_type:complete